MTELSIEEKAALLDEVFDLFDLGSRARGRNVLVNIENCKRFTEYLWAVEREFFMVPGEPDEDYPDDEIEDVCLVNSWGSTQEKYIEQFRAALEKIKTGEAAQNES